MNVSEEPSESVQERRRELKSRIEELGGRVDSYKARTAAAMGAGVFILLIAGGAVYDHFTKNRSVWGTLGVSRDGLSWVAGGLVLAGASLLAIGVFRGRRRDTVPNSKLAELENELAELREESKNQ